MQQYNCYGFTACQVLQALGANGIKPNVAQAIWPALVKAGLANAVPCVPTFTRQLGLVNNGQGNKHQLQLTAAQLAPFKALQRHMANNGLLYWPKKQPLPASVLATIGNGSTANVQQPATVLQLGNGANVQQATCSNGSTAAATVGNSLTTVG